MLIKQEQGFYNSLEPIACPVFQMKVEGKTRGVQLVEIYNHGVRSDHKCYAVDH